MTDVKHIVKTLGARAIADRLGVTRSAVSNAAMANQFPAAWYVVIAGMCAQVGLSWDWSMFTFKEDLGE